MDCSPPGSSAHGILRARTLEWVARPSSRGSFWPRDRIQVARIAGGLFTVWAVREAHECWSGLPSPPPGGLPKPGIRSGSPPLQADPLAAELPRKPPHMHTAVCETENQQGSTDSTQNYTQYFVITYKGKKTWKRMCVCVFVYNWISVLYIWTSTRLYVNFTSINTQIKEKRKCPIN